MIGDISDMYVWVEDHGRALDFCIRLLDFEVREDRMVGDRRWVVIGRPSQPGLRVVLSEIGSDPVAVHVRALLAAGRVIGGGLVSDDCRGAYAELSGKGVRFTQEPQERPYGVEAVFVDDSGNAWGLVQPR